MDGYGAAGPEWPAPRAGDPAQGDAALAGASAAAAGRVLPGRADPHVPGQAFYIPSGSMENTLLVGDRVLVNKVGYEHARSGPATSGVPRNGGGPRALRGEPNRLFEQTSHRCQLGRTVGYLIGISRPASGLRFRVIGLPATWWLCCDAKGRITVNGDSDRRAVRESQRTPPLEPRRSPPPPPLPAVPPLYSVSPPPPAAPTPATPAPPSTSSPHHTIPALTLCAPASPTPL
jgi:hypothetical protein